MGFVEAALVGLVVWVGLLTLVALVLVRQLAVLTVRYEMGGVQQTPRGGLARGTRVASETIERLPPRIRDGRITVLLTSATCGPCVELARELRDMRPRPEEVVLLLAGRAAAADQLASTLPGWLAVIRDPDASAIASSLDIDQTPFAMTLDGGLVSSKSYIRDVATLETILDQASNVPATGALQLEASRGH